MHSTVTRGPAYAIVGIGCRFPGHANSPEEFWKLLCAGVDAIGDIPEDRFDVQRFYDPNPSQPGRSYTRRAGIADHVGDFDASFFGISRREAVHVDPQQRMLLEVAWEALEDAGVPADRIAGSRTGVYVGLSSHDFASMLVHRANRDRIGAHSLTGTAGSIAANRVSYLLDLRGPSMAVDTACSSSLTAVHLACRGLAAGECDLALAGGVNLFLAPETAITMAKASMLAPDGCSKAFDARANGYVRGEGAGLVLLKPLKWAVRDRDRIYAIVRGTAINQDGHTVGMTVPSVEAQASMMRQALREAGVLPDDVQFVEAHGTGTPAGDPVEAAAIGQVFGQREPGGTCVIGSVKTNIGHLEAAAGIAGLIKAALALKHRTIPPSLHFETPNPAIAWERLRLRVTTEVEPWPPARDGARAAVNSFGVGGANAHALLEEPPAESQAEDAASEDEPCVLLLSAKTPEALAEAARRHAGLLRDGHAAIGDVCYTAAARRTHHQHRMAIVACGRDEFAARLEAPALDAIAGSAPHGGAPKLAFVYSGMGLQRPGMGRDFLRHEPVFREVLERCDAILRPWAGWSLLDAFADDSASRAAEPAVAQVTNFALQAALTEVWRTWGIVPDAVTGHSVGEVAAAYAAGALSLGDGLRLAYHRGRLAQRASGKGGMLVASLSATEATALLHRYDSRVVLAAVNSPVSVTLSGDTATLTRIAADLEKRQLFARFVPVTVPYHGPALDPYRDELLESLRPLAPAKPGIPMVSTAFGDWVNGVPLGAPHWWEEFRGPVQFARALTLLIEGGVETFVEIGPHASLKPSIMECLAHAAGRGTVLASMRRGEDDRMAMLRAAAALHVQGRPLDWHNVFQGRGRSVTLPAYPWQRESFGTGQCAEGPAAEGPAGTDSGHPLLGVRLHSARPCWQADLADARLSYLDGHVVQDAIVFPAAAYVESSLAAGDALWPGVGADIQGMEFRRMLALPQGRAAEMQWTCDAAGAFEIHSAPRGSKSWALHAVGRLVQKTVAPSDERTAFDLDTIRARCSKNISRSDWYEQSRERGFQYEGVFRGVEEVRLGRGEALARIRLAGDAGSYHIHPGLLDSAIQVLGAAIHSDTGRGVLKGTLLPASVAAIRWHGPAGACLWVHAVLERGRPDAFEGHIHLLDDAGQEVMVVERLRCLLVGAPAAAGDADDGLLYRVRWRNHVVQGRASAALPRPQQAAAQATAAAQGIAEATGIGEYYPRIEESLNDLASAFIRAALDRLGEEVDPRHHAYFTRLMEIAIEFPGAPIDVEGCLRIAAGLRETHPAWAGVIDLVVRGGQSLEQVLTGKLEAQEVWFGPEALECLSDFYCHSPVFSYYNQMVAEVVATVARERSAAGKLRILELGAGTGGTTAFVLPQLPKGAADYVFTDLSPFFLSRARTRFAGRPDVHFARLDIETGRSEGVLPHAEFDVIIAADVLHAVADIGAAVRNVRQCLAPNGLLILLEATRPMAWTDLIFGLFQGWWRFADREIRARHPLLAREQWLDVLRSEGMDDAVALPELACERPATKTVIVTRRGLDQAGEWLILADRSGVAEKFAQALERRGHSPVLLVGQALPDDLRTRTWAGVVHLKSLDQPSPDGLTASALLEFQAGIYEGTVDLLRKLAAHRDDLPPIWLVTAGAQSVGAEDPLPNAPQAGLWGLGRVLGTEFPAARCHLADLGPACESQSIELLADCMVSDDPEDELAFRDAGCFAARVERASRDEFRCQAESVVAVPPAQVRLEVGQVGSLDSLSLRQVRPVHPGPKELLVQVRAAGLNFRDVMLALGVLPVSEPAIDSSLPLGFECAGVVQEVGEAVRGFAKGDEVIAVTHGAFASHAIVRAAATVHKPEGLSFEDAATILTAFTTVHYGLNHLARVASAERVLIHSATGGVGMAAIQVCRAAGAEIFATAGTPEKRALLRSLGISHVMDSRTLAFADEIAAITSGQGVDVILNSLPGEAITRGLSILRPGGRFVELGKRDLLDNSRIGLLPFEKTLSFFSVDLDRMFRERTEQVGALAAEVMEGFADGRFAPLPRTEFALTDAPAAFRSMSQARHVGKIVLTVHEPEYRVKPTRAQWLFRRDATYLITGGLGGFGLAVAKWMLTQGARNLVLMGRRETPAPDNEGDYRELLSCGATVRFLQGDVSCEADVARVLSTIRAEMPALGGVLHAAMTLDDASLLDLTPRHWRRVLEPKACGAWLLDRLTANENLDCFVLFSSAASIVGSPMQGNYAAANAFLDALARNRRARGLPGLSLCMGMLAGTGYVSRQPEVQRYLERVGHRSITVAEALDSLELLLRSDQPHAIASRVDWSEFRRSFPAASRRRFSALPGPSDADQPARAAAEPSSAAAAMLQQVDPACRREAACAYVLQRVAKVLSEPESKIDADAALTNIGLDSLMAVELQTLLHMDLGIRIAATRLLQGITVRGLGDLILAQVGEEAPHGSQTVEPASGGSRQRSLPLASEQRRLWFLQQLHPASPVYNVPLAVRFSGNLDVSLLHRALREVVQRHEALRATFAMEAGDPVQVIAPRIDLAMPQVNLSALTVEQREAELLRCRHEEAELPFDLFQEPLIRARLLRLSRQEHILLLTMHHLVVDAWSLPVIARDTARIYQRLIDGQSPTLPVPAPGYASFIAAQQASQEVVFDQLAYWKQQLAGVPRLLLPADRPHPPERTFRGSRVELALDQEIFESLERCGRADGATLFMTLLAAFEVLLHRYSGQGDFCVGAPVATRAREEAADRVGCLVNTLALRARISGEMTFRELLRDVRDTVLGAFKHQDVTWEKVVEATQPERDPSRPPIVQVLLVVHQIALREIKFPGLAMTPEYTGNRSTTFDLVLLIDAARSRAAIEYNTDIFDAPTIERMGGHLRELLAGIASRPDSPVRELPILTEAERRQVIVEWNSTPAPWRNEGLLHSLFQEQARRTPDALAVAGETRSFTYAQLDRASNHLAGLLEARGVRPESSVAICVGRSPLAVAAMLAVLKAGGAFVPIDPAYPEERIAFVLRDAAPDLVLTEPRLAAGLRERFGASVLPVEIEELATAQATGAPEVEVYPENLAYVMYTSGSTGQPKGVLIEHRAIHNQVLWRQSAFPLGPCDTVLQTTSLSFDPSVWEIFGPLSTGAAVVIPEGRCAADGDAAGRMIRAHNVTVIQGVPSLLRALVEQQAFAGCTTLRHVFCGGEALDNRLVADLQRASGGAAIHHLYGCTETSIDATCLANVTAGEYASPPIGKPVGNARVYILDELQQPVPIGVRGELYVGGAGVARGYWRRPEWNNARFTADPFRRDTGDRMYRTGDLGRYRSDGGIELLGRADRQIKLRGYRIEPGEIEAPLRRHEAVCQAVVALRSVRGDQSLVAWLTLHPGCSLTAAEASGYLSLRVPRFMVPRHWMFLESLPLTPDGKVDCAALPDPQPAAHAGGSAPVAAFSGLERRIAEIWEELLAIRPAGIHENFFEIGGHSLLAARVAVRLSAELGCEIRPAGIFSQPTIVGLARAIADGGTRR